MINIKTQLNTKGTSMVEILITIGIFSFVATALYTVLAAGNASWETYGTVVTAHREVRGTLAQMSRELRQADNIVVTPGDDTTESISFTRPSMGTITYTWANSGPDANKIIRQDATTTRVIARDISALVFTATTDATTVDVTSTVEGSRDQTTTFSIKEKITKR